MPYGDGTGPMKSGPMAGRGFGFCAGLRRSQIKKFSEGNEDSWIISGRSGRVHGLPGRGNAWRTCYRKRVSACFSLVQENSAENEMNGPGDQANIQKRELDDLKRRIDVLERSRAPEE